MQKAAKTTAGARFRQLTRRRRPPRHIRERAAVWVASAACCTVSRPRWCCEPRTQEFAPDAMYFGTGNIQDDDDPNLHSVGMAHNLAANEASNVVYIMGSNVVGLHAVDVFDPLDPTFAFCWYHDDYTPVHDAQCVTYDGPDARYQGREVCFTFNEDNIVVLDVSDRANIVKLSQFSYDKVSYTHQGWLSSDKSHIVFGDEGSGSATPPPPPRDHARYIPSPS